MFFFVLAVIVLTANVLAVIGLVFRVLIMHMQMRFFEMYCKLLLCSLFVETVFTNRPTVVSQCYCSM